MTLEGLKEGRQYLDVMDPVGMKERLERLSLSNWLLCIDKALAKGGYTRADVDYLATLLVKRSAHDYLMEALGSDRTRPGTWPSSAITARTIRSFPWSWPWKKAASRREIWSS